MLINQYVNAKGTPVPITSKNVLQFTNVDGVYTAPINHSAVGFKGNAFPAKPYPFPSPLAVATGIVSSTNPWSTGRIAPSTSVQCYSQTFTLKPGTYYFGDFDQFNVATFNDVLIVATPSAATAGRQFHQQYMVVRTTDRYAPSDMAQRSRALNRP